MITALRFLLSPQRLRFMRRYAKPAAAELRGRLQQCATPQGRVFVTTLLQANAEFLAHAFSPSGALASKGDRLSAQSVRACLTSMLIYSVNLFARTEMAKDNSELVTLLSRTLDMSRQSVMLRRDSLRKAPRSEEWMLYTWLLKDLQAPAPKFDSALEQAFGYQYLSYIGQYKAILEKNVPGGDQ
ncbi:MAG TPA: hypothetical protein VKB84_16400 [Candidatus Binataceae bacterium]|nr:hypothetical protein [Candidatus Binataceae bacterium]